MNYTYSDGNNNVYKILNGYLSYSPMTANESSSGSYSGGKAFKKELSKIDLMRFVDVLERAIWNSDDHINKRAMGSGCIIKNIGQDKTVIFLKMNSETLTEVNGLFLKYREGE